MWKKNGPNFATKLLQHSRGLEYCLVKLSKYSEERACDLAYHKTTEWINLIYSVIKLKKSNNNYKSNNAIRRTSITVSFSSLTSMCTVKDDANMLMNSSLLSTSSFLTSSPCTFVDPSMPYLYIQDMIAVLYIYYIVFEV